MNTFNVGDKVTPDPNNPRVPKATIGRIFTVGKVNPKNLRCNAVDGGRGINFPADCLIPADGSARPTVGKPYVPAPEPHTPGGIVTLRRSFGDWDTNTPMVVIRCNGNRTTVVPLGGTGAGVRVPLDGLTRRDMAWLLARQ